jgi:hypothetical protein
MIAESIGTHETEIIVEEEVSEEENSPYKVP